MKNSDLVKRAEKIISTLREEFPEAKCALHHEGPFQLLIATILSAQCTDDRVNKVTPELFKQAPTALAMKKLGLKKIETLISSINFYPTKAKNIFKTCEILVKQYKEEVPQNLEDLVALPGVGRKTANVVLGNAFGVPSMVVDTHVQRISHRLKLVPARSNDPEKIELDLQKVYPPKDWVQFSHLLILHGRKTCTARRTFCQSCTLAKLCPSFKIEE